MTQVNNYDWGSLSTPARSYGYYYVSSTLYTNRYIFNRLQQAGVTPSGGSPITLVTNTYDGGGLSSFSGGTPSEWDTSYYSVSARGNLTTSTDVSGITTGATYDFAGNVVASTSGTGVSSSSSISSTTNFAAPDQITVGSTLTESFTYSAFIGVTGSTGPNGTSVSIGYDANARPTSTTSPFGATTTNSYTDSSSSPSTCTMVDGRWTKTSLDGLGRPLIVYTGYGTSCGSGTTLTQAESAYDSCGCSPLGKLIETWIPHNYGTSTSTTATISYTYDGIGRTLSKAAVGAATGGGGGGGPDTQGVTYYSYQGRTVTVTDPAGVKKLYTTDTFGNLVTVVEDPAGLNYSTTYTYDALNHLIGVSMPRPTGTQTRSWSYTGNFLMSATNPENGTTSYTYGSNNLVATKTDAKGQVVTYAYDSLARLTQTQRYASGTYGYSSADPCQEVDYYYDGNNPLSSSYPTNASGKLSAIQYWGGFGPTTPSCDTTFTEMYNYGVPGAPVGKQLTVSRAGGSGPISFNLAASYTYDTEGRITAENYPTDTYGATSSLGYTFDSMGRLNTMTDNIAMATIVGGATYGPANERTGISPGTTGYFGESRTYNSLKQVTGIGNIQYNYPLTNNNGKISSQTDLTSGETVTYTYDTLNRLATAENQCSFSTPWGQSFTYDGFGNLNSTSIPSGCSGYTAPTFSNASNLQNQNTTSDADGNPYYVPLPAYGTSVPAVFDIENRLVSLNGSSSTPVAYYSYDPTNHRVWRGNWSSGVRTQDEVTFWSINGQKLATYSVTQYSTALTATQSTSNEYFGSKLIQKAGVPVYPDRLGSIGKFYPYGAERPTATANDTEKFTGYFRDAESGNDYAVNRYSSPGNGRFLTPDRLSGTAANPGSWNKYAYVTGDPINRVDPRGAYGYGGDDDDDDAEEYDYCAELWQEVSTTTDPDGITMYNLYCGNITNGVFGPPPPLPSGGGGGAQVAVMPTLSGTFTTQQEARFDDGYDTALLYLENNNATCANFFAGNPIGGFEAALADVQDAMANTDYRAIQLGAGVGAQTNSPTSVFLNTTGAFFTNAIASNGTVTVSMPNGQGVTSQFTFASVQILDAFLLLHELGHQMGAYGATDADGSLFADGTPNPNGLMNNGINSAAVLNNCFTQINGVWQ